MGTQTETHLTPLTRIELGLHEVGFETQYVSKSDIEASPYEQLLVVLEELNGNPLIARLAFTEDIARANAIVAKLKPPLFKVSTLLITVRLPIKENKDKLSEMAQLVTAINRQLPMGSFGASEADGFYFRYAMMDLRADQIDVYLVVIALETILALIKRYISDMAALIYDKASLPAILKKIEQKAN